ncbi:glycerophosphodiester phosphodiesterase family protein [Fundidesulfovibrio agrisoli]|uniref:glycerophosphodiester phosphodiesterase family protein n=1 Tax=Fundidesulfovibrio agrisoli TaxID=2922717 RepID=UPI001FACAD77|nr:glycerophosphodiester phosphodiesterase family protein [Fundidesulfovibrio agrisoli]
MPDWLRDTPIAHRGLHDNVSVAENSLTAFERCAGSGIPIELDVRLTGDGRVVAFHDKGLTRACGVDGLLRERPYAEISGYGLFGTGDTIPLFSEVLELVAGRSPLLVEIKGDGPPGQLEGRVAALLDGYGCPFAVQAFNPLSVLWFRRHRPNFLRGQLVYDYADKSAKHPLRSFAYRNMLLNAVTQPHFAAVDITMLAGWRLNWLMKVRERMPVLVWTARSRERRKFCAEHGFNAIYEEVRPEGGATGVEEGED